VQAAVKIVIEPIFEADFRPCSFGFPPRRGAHDALQVLTDESWRGRRWVVEADIASCFEAIPHDRLMQAIEDRICGRRLLRLLGAMLHAGYGGGRGQAQRHRHAAGRISIRVPIEPRPSAAARSTRFSRAT
jgi:retron-type reverse transcriptase